MTGELFLVAYDGEDHKVIDCAVHLARLQGARLHIVHVIHWSPYTFLTPQELATRHKQRQEELDFAREKILTPALERVRSSGLAVDGEIRHGIEADVISAIASERKAALIFVGRSRAASARVFGSVASGLAQCAPVPTVIVP